MTRKTKSPVTTAPTHDRDAIHINNQLNDVARMIEVGQEIKKIIAVRFSGDLKGFRRWVRMNLDKDEKSILRYLTLAEYSEYLTTQGIIRLSDAYALLGLDFNVSVARFWNIPEDDLLEAPAR